MSTLSVLSDISITELCVPPTHVYEYWTKGEGLLAKKKVVPIWRGLSHTDEEMAKLGAVLVSPEDPRVKNFKPMIEPFHPESIRRVNDERIASFGVSSYGYDFRAAPEYKLFKGELPVGSDGVVDYKNITEDMFEHHEGPSIVIPPHGFILARSVERVRIPRNILALCIGKSTIARVGINCLCTPIEPEWEGYITFEFHNTLSLPNRFYANEGVLQLIFLKGDRDCRTSYNDRGGKYQGQANKIIIPRV